MNIKYSVQSRSKAKALSYTKLSTPSVIISIINTGSDCVHFAPNPQIKAILCLTFDDVDRNESHEMTDGDANQVVTFCERWLTNTNLIVQCEAGISKSAGVCAAIMKWQTGSDAQIFDTPRYRTNMHRYFQVMNAFERMGNFEYEKQN